MNEGDPRSERADLAGIADAMERMSVAVDPVVPDQVQRQDAEERVRALLGKLGSSADEIDRAIAEDTVDLLMVDRLLVPAERRLTQGELAERSGVPLDLARRVWRALGFSDVEDEEAAFTEMDVEALTLFKAMVAARVVDTEAGLQMARVIGSSMARIAEAETAPGSLPVLASSGDSVLDADLFARQAGASLPAMAGLLEYVWRRHLQAASRRAMLIRTRGAEGMSPVMAVGFADMVGFTMLSQHLGDHDLAAVVSRFEELAHDIVTALGGRVVKMIGDEAMFVVPSVTEAAHIGLSLAEAYASDDLLSDVRVSLAVGPVLLQDGDYYGPVVNLASRLVGIANPGTVLTSDEFHLALQEESDGEFSARALRPRTIKDIGRVQVWKLSRAGVPAGAERRRNLRWERLGEVLRELDELRERGEQVVAGAPRQAGLADVGAGEDPSASEGSGEPEGGDPPSTQLEPPFEREEWAAP